MLQISGRFGLLFLYISLTSVLFLGCEQPAKLRQYTEVFGDAPKKMTPPTGGMFSGMPQDDIHAGLMPQDGVRAGLMPDDDIHAGLKGSNQQDIPPMMQGMNDPALQQQISASADQTPLEWETPKGWSEKRGGGLRLATFASVDPKTETTIVSLSGSAGGLVANATRWIQQLNIPVPGAQELDSFIQRQEKFSTDKGMPVTLIDLTQMQNDSPPDAPSMIAAVIEKEGSQIFVKMTGPKPAVLSSRDTLKSFVKSIHLK